MAEGKVAAVTGGASGIGRATCEVLHGYGWTVAVLDRDEAGARAVADAIGGAAFAVDVADEASVTAAFARVATECGRVDGLATCAGITDATPFFDLDVATWERTYRINVLGTFLCIREAARHMARGGRICTIASVSGKRGGRYFGTAAYAASKGAVLALTRTAARELAERGIAVNSIAPGPVETPMIATPLGDPAVKSKLLANVPLGRAAQPAEIAEAIAFLLSPHASYIDGEVVMVDGGTVMD